MPKIRLEAIDYVILGIYLLFVLGIGVALRRQMRTSADFFLSARSLPAWVTGLAFSKRSRSVSAPNASRELNWGLWIARANAQTPSRKS